MKHGVCAPIVSDHISNTIFPLRKGYKVIVATNNSKCDRCRIKMVNLHPMNIIDTQALLQRNHGAWSWQLQKLR